MLDFIQQNLQQPDIPESRHKLSGLRDLGCTARTGLRDKEKECH